MKLSEYSDEEFLEELKHRGFKIEAHVTEVNFIDTVVGKWPIVKIAEIKIGGVCFDISK